jgi:MFS family permease
LTLIIVIFILYVWDRFVYGVELPQIMKATGLQLAVAGFLASVFTLGLAIMMFPGGFISARFGNRSSLVAGAVVFSLFTALTGVATGFVDTLLYRILTGVGEGLYNISILTFLGSLTRKYRGTSVGVAASLFGIGGFTGPLVATYSLAVTGDWRLPFFLFGGAGLVGALLVFFVVKPSDVNPVQQEKRVHAEEGGEHGLAVLKDRRVIAACINMLAAGLAVYSYISLYTVFLERDNGISLIDAGFIVALFGIGQIVGGTPLGYVADLIGRRWAVGSYAIVVAISSLVVFSMHGSVVLYGVTGFIYGACANALYINSVVMMQGVVPRSMMSVGTGVASVYYITAAVSGYVTSVGSMMYGWAGASVIIIALPSFAAGIITFILGSGRLKPTQ